jgi:hypothetical protein
MGCILAGSAVTLDVLDEDGSDLLLAVAAGVGETT